MLTMLHWLGRQQAKVNDLVKRYPQLLAPILQPKKFGNGSSQKIPD